MSTSFTPMIRQFLEIKEKYPGEIVFFRLGDFYEMFFQDAHIASKELEITLTGKDAGSNERVPMCGVPYHAADNYIKKLINKGYKVAICEQVSDPKQEKGIVSRQVVKIVTPGTILLDSVLNEKSNNYICLLYEKNNKIYICSCDISTGEFSWIQLHIEQNEVEDYLLKIQPSELLYNGEMHKLSQLKEFMKTKMTDTLASVYNCEDYNEALQLVAKHFKDKIPTDKNAALACGMLLKYLEYTQKSDLRHINFLQEDFFENILAIDASSLRNLEIIKNMKDGTKKNSLFSVLDFTCTAMGGRLLKKWLEQPLQNPIKIKERQDVIAILKNDPYTIRAINECLTQIYDLERILTKIEINSANARDLVALSRSLKIIPKLKNIFKGSRAKLLANFSEKANSHTDLYKLINKAIVDQPPISIKDGGFIRGSYNSQLDEFRMISQDSKKMLQEMEKSEREITGIKSLKIGYNKIFGYYIEVTHANSVFVPTHYTRRQTLVNAERYITQQLKEFETKILSSFERICEIELYIFEQIRALIKENLVLIQETARQIAIIDCLYSLSEAALKYNYTRPKITIDKEIIIKDGRHPVIESVCLNGRFVPNDCYLDNNENEVIIITGPNMAGKSTYMRQIAILTLMAHCGSFIPAYESSIGMVDKIFTRIGARDDLSTGQSTFMMEMNEVSYIVKNSTSKSLIILDEIGRGTSTYDGMSIAKAVLEYIKEKICAKTLFATHYHELTSLADVVYGIKNYFVAVKEQGENIVFLRRIIQGKTDKSYGVHVASIAGLPRKIINSAQKNLIELEEKNGLRIYKSTKSINSNVNGNQLFVESETIKQLTELDIISITPVEALNILFNLHKQAKKEQENVRKKNTIKLLDKQTIDKIAAGEVIDRPASIVKELVENSIDAQSTIIEIEAENGGISLISVIDNGIGMNNADAKLCLQKHATSKITNIKDLTKISSMGFRGEALSSISAISKFTLVTRQKDVQFATSSICCGGTIENVSETGSAMGTTIIVKDLFYNIPARKKFLKLSTTENSYISDIITKLALSYPNISFKYIHNKKLVIVTPGNNDLKVAITALYDKKTVNNILPVEYTEDRINIYGYVGNPMQVRSNRKWQNFFVNSRSVNNRILYKALDNSYQAMLPKTGFVFSVINIYIDPQMIDINVHPQKSEVRFSDERRIFLAIFKAISAALNTGANKFNNLFYIQYPNSASNVREEAIQYKNINQTDISLSEISKQMQTTEVLEVEKENQWVEISKKEYININLIQEKNNGNNYEIEILGQYAKSFILAQINNELFIIDQHAAQERVIFDKLNIDEQRIPAQKLLIEEIINLSVLECQIAVENTLHFFELGYSIELYSPDSLRIMEIPSDLNNKIALEVFLKLLCLIQTNVKINSGQLRREFLRTAACHASVRAGDRLTNLEMYKITDDMLTKSKFFVCPHGRPIVLKYSLNELYKIFKRT